MSHQTEASVVRDLVIIASQPTTEHGGIPFVVVPDGHKLSNLEALMPLPARKRGEVMLRDLASFIAFVVAEWTSVTRIYANGDRTKPSFTAVFNDHGVEPGWRDHKATYACPLSPEWQTWTKADRSPMTQQVFAQFIEANLRDIVPVEFQPSPADMLEVSRTLEAKTSADFKSAVKLQNGEVQFKFEENIQASARNGELQVPATFMLGIPVFESGEKYQVLARLRYRIKEGSLSMWFELDQPHLIVDDAIKLMREKVATETGAPVFNGALS